MHEKKTKQKTIAASFSVWTLHTDTVATCGLWEKTCVHYYCEPDNLVRISMAHFDLCGASIFGAAEESGLEFETPQILTLLSLGCHLLQPPHGEESLHLSWGDQTCISLDIGARCMSGLVFHFILLYFVLSFRSSPAF